VKRIPPSAHASPLCALVFGGALLASTAFSFADPTILDDFEGGSEGHFGSLPTLSGTNRNITSATADQSNLLFYSGLGSEHITVNPQNPGTAPDFPSTNYRLRFLSGGGTPANNVNIGATGYVGYFLRTSTPGLVTAPGLDDGAALELGVFQNVIADNAWHLYQFNLADANQWDPFAGTGPNGSIEGPTVTIDSIFIQGLTANGTTDVSLDTVAYNPNGDLTTLVPEPGSCALLSFAGLALLARRKR